VKGTVRRNESSAVGFNNESSAVGFAAAADVQQYIKWHARTAASEQNMIDVDLFGSIQKLQRMRACLKSYSSASSRAVAAGYIGPVKDLNKVCSSGT
jgi:hypothetical protein